VLNLINLFVIVATVSPLGRPVLSFVIALMTAGRLWGAAAAHT
jgi:hypothetical protein